MRKEAAANGRLGATKWLIVALSMAAGMLAYGIVRPDADAAEREDTGADNGYLDKSPPRQIKGLQYTRSGQTYGCMECHRSLEAKWHVPERMMEHRDLELKHGTNRFCLNCHHPENRNVYVDYDGSEIAESNVEMLCGKCHGPQHRDWQAGVHGRRNGYWDASRGPTSKLSCIQCHDPHDPGFKKMMPLTAPSYPRRAAGQADAIKQHHGGTKSHG